MKSLLKGLEKFINWIKDKEKPKESLKEAMAEIDASITVLCEMAKPYFADKFIEEEKEVALEELDYLISYLLKNCFISGMMYTEVTFQAEFDLSNAQLKKVLDGMHKIITDPEYIKLYENKKKKIYEGLKTNRELSKPLTSTWIN